MEIQKGIYQHYKGKRYEVLGMAKHSETLEELVVYRPLYPSDTEFWVRPASMWNDLVSVEGKTVRRFEKI